MFMTLIVFVKNSARTVQLAKSSTLLQACLLLLLAFYLKLLSGESQAGVEGNRKEMKSRNHGG